MTLHLMKYNKIIKNRFIISNVVANGSLNDFTIKTDAQMLDVWNHLTVKCFVLLYGRCKVVCWLSFEHLPSCRPPAQKRIMPPLLILPKICEDIYGADTSNIALSSSATNGFFSQKETGNSDSSYAQKMGFGFWKTYIDKWV